MRIDLRDSLGGLLMVVVGLIFVLPAHRYGIGSATAMKPGFMPLMVGILAILIGLGLVIQALFTAAPPPSMAWRAVAFTSVSIAAFALLVGHIGLIPGLAISIAISAKADPANRWPGIVVLALALCLVSWAIFIAGLGLPIAAFDWRW